MSRWMQTIACVKYTILQPWLLSLLCIKQDPWPFNSSGTVVARTQRSVQAIQVDDLRVLLEMGLLLTRVA
jgi:hypothetical protein